MANCLSCSAPLPVHSSLCDYCGTRNDIDLKGIHEYTVQRPLSERICPACTIPMQTINVAGAGKFYIERCERCLGLFFDPGELEAILDRSVENVYRIDYKGITRLIEDRAKRPSDVNYVKCPVCATMMNRVNFGLRSGVIIDQCKGHGIWLDSGQLKQLMEWRKKGGKLLHDQRTEEEKKRKEKEAIKAVADRRAPFQPPGHMGSAEADKLETSLDFIIDIADTIYDFLK